MAKKNTVPKNVLTPIKVRATEKPVETGDVLTIQVEGDYPGRYNEASSIGKKAEQLMKDLKPAMLPDALNRIFERNTIKPWEPISSVAFQDEKGEVTRVTFANKYATVPVEVAEALFLTLRLRAKKGEEPQPPNINEYLSETLVGAFDSEAFLGPDGKFDRRKYTVIMGALDKAADELSIKNPLSITKVIKPLPNFHARRWIDFDRENNDRITKVIQNQVVFSPCPNAFTGKMAGEDDKADKS